MPLPPAIEDENLLRGYLQLLRKRRWTIISVFLIVVATGIIRTFLQTPIYRATARVMIEPEAPKVLNIQEVNPTGGNYYFQYQLTQQELIKSRPVIEKAIENLDLTKRLPELAGVKDPVAVILSSVIVSPLKETSLVDIKFDHPDPTLAADVATAIARAYTRNNLDIKMKNAREALAWLSEQMNELGTKVRDSSMALQNYRVKAGIVGIKEQREITTGKIMNFNTAYLEAQAQRLAVEAKLKEIQAIAKDPTGAQTLFIVADNPMIQKLKDQAAQLRIEVSKALETLGPKHPRIIELRAQGQEIEKKLDAEIQTMLQAVNTELRVARARENALQQNVERLRQEAQQLSEKEIDYQRLEREVNSNQQMQDTVLTRVKEMGVSGALETNNLRVVEEAQVPKFPIKPQKLREITLAIITGLLAGIGLAFFLERLDNTIRTPEEVQRYLGSPVLGVVPIFEGKR
jgi:succinoglycan biosynthesis transport protein ExoP